jgi:oligoribonuclease NrnB/cAMP/cGMP phosphodiesterase (DHH superfamily)
LVNLVPDIKILDHHVSSYNSILPLLESNPELRKNYIYNVNESGATLAWFAFYTTEPPEFIRYIKDRDLWKFEMINSRDINDGLYYLLGFNLDDWDKFSVNLSGISHALELELLKKHRDQRIKILMTKGSTVKWELTELQNENTVFAVNSTEHISDLGENIYMNGFTVAAIWAYDGSNKRYHISLRSNSVDVSKIAEKYGGGGHKFSSGFSCEKLPWI